MGADNFDSKARKANWRQCKEDHAPSHRRLRRANKKELNNAQMDLFLQGSFDSGDSDGFRFDGWDVVGNDGPTDIQLRMHRNQGTRRRKHRAVVAFNAEQWVLAHPEVYNAFKSLAIESRQMGHKHIGAKMLAEIIRWKTKVPGGKDFKVSNSAVTYMARKFMEEHPEYQGFFRTKVQKQ